MLRVLWKSTLAGLAVWCALAPATAAPAAPAGDWRVIKNLGTVIGADGLPHTATCSAFPGTNPAYRFWVRRGDPKKLAVLFDGGGACWDDLTCSHPFADGRRDPLLQFYTPSIPRDANPSQYGGMLDLSNPANPVRDWTVVIVPYCTGDVHLGSVDRTYRRVGPPMGPVPEQFQIRHRGYDNFMVVLDWIGRHVSDPRDLLVAGASAGGYGAAGHFPWLAQRYPHARLSVLADASQGVATTGFDSGTPGRGSWQLQLPPWVFGSDPLGVPSNDLLYVGAKAYPQARLAQYTTVADSVQVGFYAYMKLLYGPGGSCPGITADWNQQMLTRLAGYQAELPNFRSYLAPGSDHTILASDSFYTASPASPAFASWLGAMLDGSPNAPPWSNVACPGCLTPLPCP